MKSTSANENVSKFFQVLGEVALVCLCASILSTAQQSAAEKAPPTTVAPVAGARGFDTPQQAAEVLVDAATKFDVVALAEIFGPNGQDIVFSGEFTQDRKRAADFAAEAHEKKSVSVDPKSGNRAFLLVGNEDWPFPVTCEDGKQMVFRCQSRQTGTPVPSHRRQ
jgi:hypothetical protein